MRKFRGKTFYQCSSAIMRSCWGIASTHSTYGSYVAIDCKILVSTDDYEGAPLPTFFYKFKSWRPTIGDIVEQKIAQQ
jgi:hypothetical protein